MSLDVYLKFDVPVQVPDAIYVREGGRNVQITAEEWNRRYPDRAPVTLLAHDTHTVFSANITHNLGTMAEHAGVYGVLWHPEESQITHAQQLIEPLKRGLALLKARPDESRKYNPPNGWGTYETLLAFIEEYLSACEQYPQSKVSVWR